MLDLTVQFLNDRLRYPLYNDVCAGREKDMERVLLTPPMAPSDVSFAPTSRNEEECLLASVA